MATVSFVDETTAGGRTAGWALEIFDERLTLRELIRRRIFQEVAEHNAAQATAAGPAPARSRVEPGEVERALNGTARHLPRRLDPQRHYLQALDGFTRNRFVVLVGDRQVTGLDDVIDLRRDTEVTFLKLVPLVGG